MQGVIWLPLSNTFSNVPPIEATRGLKVSSRRSVSSIVSELNLTCIKNSKPEEHYNNIILNEGLVVAGKVTTSSVRWTLYDFLKQSQFSDGVGLNSDTPSATYDEYLNF